MLSVLPQSFLNRVLLSVGILCSVMTVGTSHAQDFLPPDQAFVLNSQSLSEDQAQLQWKIAEDYYLYHQKFQVLEQGKAVKLSLPKGQPKQDPTFGLTDVHYNHVTASFKTQPNQQYQVIWQGCASSGLCYPPQRKTLQTDEYGLLLLEQKQSLSSFRTTANQSPFGQNKASSLAQNDVVQTVETSKSDLNPTASQPMASQAETAKSKNATEQNKTANTASNKHQTMQPAENPKAGESSVKSPASQPLTSHAKIGTMATTATNPASATTTPLADEREQEIATHSVASQAVSSDATSAMSADSEIASTAVAQPNMATMPVAMQNGSLQNPSKISLNNDQTFLNLLNQHHMGFNLLLFLGFGILLAFLPCSLPLIPILSSVLIQQQKGYRAMLIALVFVLSMASVYAVMGILVSSLGYGFQRFFQQAWVLVLFSSLFVLFAFNLFGYFELSLPQKWLNHLNQLHHKQQGGQVGSAAVMGVLSALIVGPCMSAPLAGALIYVSQLQNYVLGAIYLFALGLGIGIPVFIVSVFGTRFIPKAGEWMNHLKVLFGFLMLAMAVYFIRPLLQIEWYQGLLALISLITVAYIAYLIWKAEKHIAKISLTVLAVVLSSFAVSQIQQAWFSQKNNQLVASEQRVIWQKVRTKAEFEQALQHAQQQAITAQQPILVDVYADWCVACQPIERQILPRQDVQAVLQKHQRIKLDLTDYEESQDTILQQWQILGPPTMLFIDGNGQEYRDLRLTGAFTAEDLKSRLP